MDSNHVFVPLTGEVPNEVWDERNMLRPNGGSQMLQCYVRDGRSPVGVKYRGSIGYSGTEERL